MNAVLLIIWLALIIGGYNASVWALKKTNLL